MEIVWGMVVFFVVLHTLAAYGFYLAVTAASYKTYAWSKRLSVIAEKITFFPNNEWAEIIIQST